MSYRYSIEDLLTLLHERAPAKVDAVALHRRRVEHGLLSVGLKIHCLDDGHQFSTLVEGLGGPQTIVDINYYKQSKASLCLVLPPVGSARSAILLLECIEHFIGLPLFSNPKIQIQVCSPGRLDARRSALVAIGFYLGSDTLRRYTLGELETSFTKHHYDPRGRRLVLYDAAGDFDRNFDWWKQVGKNRLVESQLPFVNGRTDLLTGSGSRLDIQNINLLATLLVHAQYQGYWSELGMQFQEEMEALLERHILKGLVDAPWVRTDDPKSADDVRFFAAPESLLRTRLKRVSVSRREAASSLGGTRHQSGHRRGFCRKCKPCFRSTAVNWSGRPAFSIKENRHDFSCSSTRLRACRYSGDNSQPGRGTEAKAHSDRTRSEGTNPGSGESSLGQAHGSEAAQGIKILPAQRTVRAVRQA